MMFFKMQTFWFWGLLIIFCAETKNFLSPLAFSCLRFDMFFWLSHWKINQTCMILKRSAVCLLPSANREKKMPSIDLWCILRCSSIGIKCSIDWPGDMDLYFCASKPAIFTKNVVKALIAFYGRFVSFCQILSGQKFWISVISWEENPC